MIEDEEIINDFVVESKEHLADIENQMLTIESNGERIDVDLVNTVFRGVHSIKGAAGFLGLTKINQLAHSLENVLNLIREQDLVPTPSIVDCMLQSADLLSQMIDDCQSSNDVDVSELTKSLDSIASGKAPETSSAPTTETSAIEEASIPVSVEASSIEQSLESSDGDSNISPSETPLPPSTSEKQQPPMETKPSPKPEAAAPANQNGKPKPGGSPSNKSSKPAAESNIRVSVETLDLLMNLAGELVLSRNQLLQSIASTQIEGLDNVSARINQVTSELQDAIMQTRMQPIGNIFTRFSRVVRDLSNMLGKSCQLVVEGKEVEVDKTILEAIGDPLTHLIRNAVDHGLETPEERRQAGKKEQGLVHLRALHQSDKVRILIQDDGRGLNTEKIKSKAVEKGLLTSEQARELSDREVGRLIFHPGFSTAEKVSDVSGRGVGMDVVRTNIEKLGGTVEIDSVFGSGSTIEVTLPLTLAIIPSLIVASEGARFAIPQTNIRELVRVAPSERQSKIGNIKGAEVLRLRGSLLPLVRLNETFGTSSSNTDECETGCSTEESLNIVVVDTGQQSYGLVVNELFDSEEIVVRPLGRHFKNCQCLSGATILGDGCVALILDVTGIASHSNLRSISDGSKSSVEGEETSKQNSDNHSCILFRNHPAEQFAIPTGVVSRIERIASDQIDSVGGMNLLQYGDSSLPVLNLEDHINAKPREVSDRVFVAVFNLTGREIGLVLTKLEDIRRVPAEIDMDTLKEPGVIGSVPVDGIATRMIDLFELAEAAHPEWFTRKAEVAQENQAVTQPRVLLAEDSEFFRKQVKKYLVEVNMEVIEAEDGLEAWNLLQGGEQIDLVVTDIQMPNMTGFELCHKIKSDDELKKLPVIALTSLAGEEDMKKGQAVGVDDYQVKMDRERLLDSVTRFAQTARKTQNSPQLAGV